MIHPPSHFSRQKYNQQISHLCTIVCFNPLYFKYTKQQILIIVVSLPPNQTINTNKFTWCNLKYMDLVHLNTQLLINFPSFLFFVASVVTAVHLFLFFPCPIMGIIANDLTCDMPYSCERQKVTCRICSEQSK